MSFQTSRAAFFVPGCSVRGFGHSCWTSPFLLMLKSVEKKSHLQSLCKSSCNTLCKKRGMPRGAIQYEMVVELGLEAMPFFTGFFNGLDNSTMNCDKGWLSLFIFILVISLLLDLRTLHVTIKNRKLSGEFGSLVFWPWTISMPTPYIQWLQWKCQ